MRIMHLAPMLAALCAVATAYADDATGRSYYQPRLPWSEQALMLADDASHKDLSACHSLESNGRSSSKDRTHGRSQKGEKERRCCHRGFSFGSLVQYEASTSDGDFAKYFLPNGKNNLTVKGAALTGDRDISATWLQIAGENPGTAGTNPRPAIFHNDPRASQWFNEYASTISIKPHFERTSATTQLRYSNKLMRVPWSLSIGLPVAQMRTTVRLSETDVEHSFANRSEVPALVTDVTGTVVVPAQNIPPQYSLSAIEAFSNPNKRYGKMSSNTLEARGLGDLSIDLNARPISFLTLGVRGEIPTSQEATAEYLFEPLLGSNGHGTIAAYAMLHKDIYNFEHGAITLKGYGQYQAQLPANELRTFDLTESGAWSRYLLLMSFKDGAANPYEVDSGVNLLTRSVRVASLQNMTLGAGFEARYKGFNASLGYSLFAREQEKLTLRGDMPANTFIAGQLAPLSGGLADPKAVYAGQKSVSISSDISINVDALGDPATTPDLALTNADLNVTAGSMPQYFSHQLAATLGYTGRVHGQLLHLNVGGSYEMLRYGNSYDVYSLFGMLTLKI